MNIVSNIYVRIITTAHHIITKDDINNYNEDFTGLLTFKNQENYQKFHEVGESIASILLQKKLGVFVMAYDTIAFCIRFHSNYSFSRINLRMISDSLRDIPSSSGDPIFMIGADDLAGGFGWKPVQPFQTEEEAEIFPIIDFKRICIYYAISKKHDSAKHTPQIFRSLSSKRDSLSNASDSKKINSNSQLKSETISQSLSEPFFLASQPLLNSSSNSNSVNSSESIPDSLRQHELNTEFDNQFESEFDSVSESLSHISGKHRSDSDNDESNSQSFFPSQNLPEQSQLSSIVKSPESKSINNLSYMNNSQKLETQKSSSKVSKNLFSIFDTSSNSSSNSNSPTPTVPPSIQAVESSKQSMKMVESDLLKDKNQTEDLPQPVFLKKMNFHPFNLFDHSTSSVTSTSTSTSTSMFASSSTSNAASPTLKISPHKISRNTPPKRQKNNPKRLTKRSKSSNSKKSGEKAQNDKMIQKKLPLQINHVNKSSSFSEDKNESQKHRLKQQQLPVTIIPAKPIIKQKTESDSQKRLFQSKLPLVKNKKAHSNFSSDSFTDQSSNSSSFMSSSNPSKEKKSQNQLTLPLEPSKKSEKK